MLDASTIERLGNATVVDAAGDKIGKIGQIYVDDVSGQPTFVTVSTGLFGTSESFVPLNGASVQGDYLRVQYSKDQVKDAPRIDADGNISPAEEDRLYSHYQLDNPGVRSAAEDRGTTDPALAGAAAGTEGTRDHDRGETETLTAHEERLNVGTRTEETGRARLLKYTTTETESVEVPVSKEKLVVEREDAGGVVHKGGLDSTTDDVVDEEIVLREERPVVEKETLERERVRVGKEKVTGTETVSEEVRTEHIDVEGEADGKSPRAH